MEIIGKYRMNKKRFIELFKEYPDDAEVFIWNGDGFDDIVVVMSKRLRKKEKLEIVVEGEDNSDAILGILLS
jgi:phosphotransferase system HPr-like phosphotransfer protein